MSFEELGLIPELLRAVADTGYTTPTPIQAQAIPIVLAGRDVMGGAQTGTGRGHQHTRTARGLRLKGQPVPGATPGFLRRRATQSMSDVPMNLASRMKSES